MAPAEASRRKARQGYHSLSTSKSDAPLRSSDDYARLELWRMRSMRSWLGFGWLAGPMYLQRWLGDPKDGWLEGVAKALRHTCDGLATVSELGPAMTEAMKKLLLDL